MSRKMRAICACLCVLTISGCGTFNTRPGHPDSWHTAYLDDDIVGRKWSQREPSFRIDKMVAASPVYQTAKTPGEIWQARGYAFNMHRRYQAAAYKAQDVQDQLAIPLFGAAIATVATGLARAGTVAVAATGLGGASLGAGASYLHPEKDAATSLAANAALLCVVDRSKALNDLSAIPLVLDRAALQDALNQMRTTYGSLLTGLADTKGKAAVQAVEAAAEATMKALDAAIAAYVALPGELFEVADTIDQRAQQNGARTLDYAALLKTLQTSASNQAATDKAKADVQTASAATADAKLTKSSDAQPSVLTQTVTVVSGVVGTPDPVEEAPLKPTTDHSPTTDNAALKPAKQGANDLATAAKVATDAKGAAELKETELKKTLSKGLSDVTRVNVLARGALHDIPTPNFSAIASNIKDCALPK